MEIISLEVTGREINAAIINEKGQISTQIQTPLAENPSPALLLQTIFNAAAQLCDSAWMAKEVLSDICITLPAQIDTTGKELQSSIWPGIEKFPLALMLEQQIPGMNVSLYNNALAAACGEYQQGALRGNRNSLLLEISEQLQCGMIFNGIPYAGGTNQGCRIGRLLDQSGHPFGLTCSTKVLTEAGKKCFTKGSPLYQRCGGQEVRINERTVLLSAAEDGELGRICRQWLHSLSELLFELIMFADPQKIAVRGAITGTGEAFFTPLAQLLAEKIDSPSPCPVVKSVLEKQAACLGGAMLFFDQKNTSEKECMI